MCWSVLNDEWASHPTWASEDSGFVAHRKNGFEEALHRIEEERHDYDYNIESAMRTMQLLEPIAQSISRMTQEERANFTLSPGLGSQSAAVHQRVIKKLYGREKGQAIIERVLNHPCAAVPIVLARLKVKIEEWQAIQVGLPLTVEPSPFSIARASLTPTHSANGRRYGVSKQPRCTGRVWTIWAPAGDRPTRSSSRRRLCSARCRFAMSNSDGNPGRPGA